VTNAFVTGFGMEKMWNMKKIVENEAPFFFNTKLAPVVILLLDVEWSVYRGQPITKSESLGHGDSA
jgi:hypothetical protein